jgi:pilus assembly protein CpaB
MNRQAFVIALILAASGTALLLLYLKRFEQQMAGGPRVTLVTVVSQIERGSVLTEKMLATREVPLAYVESRAVKLSERNKVLGLATATRLNPNETLMWSDLEVATEERDLSALVQPGKRAVTVPTTVTDPSQNALIHPGDYVDVVATLRPQGDASESTSAVLLQRVLVLAVGQETQGIVASKSNDGVGRDRLLTLSLNIQETQILALALDRGRLSVAVRNPHDHATELDIPDLKSSALLDTRVRSDLQRATARAGTVLPARIEASR